MQGTSYLCVGWTEYKRVWVDSPWKFIGGGGVGKYKEEEEEEKQSF